MTSRIVSGVTKLSKQKLIPAMVVATLGSYCSVRLSGNGKQINRLRFYGPVPNRGDACQVNYQTGAPYVQTQSVPAKETPAPIIFPPDPPIQSKGTIKKTYTWPIGSPAIAGIPGVKLPENCVVVKISAYVTGGTSATFNIEHGFGVGPGGDDLMSEDLVALTTDTVITDFPSPELSENEWLWVDISGVEGFPTWLTICLWVYLL
jgi:hypothetical protein